MGGAGRCCSTHGRRSQNAANIRRRTVLARPSSGRVRFICHFCRPGHDS
ncbi:hypothetical protein YT1_0328 [Rhodococcus ruber]|nr:hypothetical protein YT1_0328 [Rhodococcus ruber]